jgi:predicted NBD/HSP70 family sugar kinase
MNEHRLLVGVNARLDRVHTIILREEASGGLRLMGEYRYRNTVREPDTDILVQRIHDSIVAAIKDAQVDIAEIQVVGIAASGLIDDEHGNILFVPQLGMRNIPLVSLLQKYVPCPIVLINDVDAQCLGEQRIGGGKAIQQLVYLYVGYGVGASIMIGGDLYRGADHLAGEFGHTTIDLHGPPCTCGNYGCLEVLTSRAAIARKLQKLAREHTNSILAKVIDLSKDPLDMSVASIAEAIDQEDALAIQVIEEAADAFGAGIANVINFLNPQTVILGGDVIDELDLYFERAVATARKRCLEADARQITIDRGLGTTAGAYGAAVYAKQHLTRANHQTV